MSKKVTSIDKLDSEINKILEDYQENVVGSIDDATEKVGKAGAKSLQQKSRETFKGNSYWRGWKVATQKKVLGLHPATTAVIYNVNYRLPHLLENGHASRNGKRTPGRPHIKIVEQEIIDKFFKKVQESIKRTQLKR